MRGYSNNKHGETIIVTVGESEESCLEAMNEMTKDGYVHTGRATDIMELTGSENVSECVIARGFFERKR